jgi:hypothetical protein
MTERLVRLPVVVAIAIAIAVAGCNSATAGRDGHGTEAGSTPPASASASPTSSAASSGPDGAAAPTATPTDEPVASVIVPAAGLLPRSLAYGILLWTVRDAAITNQDPKRYSAGVAAPPAAKTWLIIDLDERNDNVVVHVVQDQVRFQVTLPDESVVTGVNIGRESVPAVSSAEGRYAFEVPAGTGFDGLALSIADPGREPSLELSLSGPTRPLQANTSVPVDQTVNLKIPNVAMSWTIVDQITGLDWPLPLGFKGGTLPPSTRAEFGHRWLGIVARVQVGTCSCKGGILDRANTARLFADGLPITATANASSNAILNAETISDVLLVFSVPADAFAATLQVGSLDKPEQQARFTLDLD